MPSATTAIELVTLQGTADHADEADLARWIAIVEGATRVRTLLVTVDVMIGTIVADRQTEGDAAPLAAVTATTDVTIDAIVGTATTGAMIGVTADVVNAVAHTQPDQGRQLHVDLAPLTMSIDVDQAPATLVSSLRARIFYCLLCKGPSLDLTNF